MSTHPRQDKDKTARKKKLLAYTREIGSTATNLESLVSCYEELKENKALKEKFTIPGYGTSSYQKAFRRITHGSTHDFAVYHGGARLYKRYGSGFLLSFIDKIEGIPASFYVSSEHLKNYRPGNRLKYVIDELEKNVALRPYIKIYWIGNLEKMEKKYNATFTHLSHVVFRLIYPVAQT